MESNDLQQYVDFVIDFLEPIVRATQNSENARTFLLELGYDAPSDVTSFDELNLTINDIYHVISSLDALIESDSNDTTRIAQMLFELFLKIGSAIKHLNNFNTKVQENFSGTPFLTETDILIELPIKLVDYLFAHYLENNSTTLYSTLIVLGIVEETFIEESPPYTSTYLKRKLHWDRIPVLFTDPVQSLRNIFLAEDEIRFDNLIYILEKIGISLGVFAEVNLPEITKLNGFNASNLTTLPAFDQIRYVRLPLTSDPFAQLALEIYPVINVVNQKCEAVGVGIIFGSQTEIPIGDKFELKIDFSTSLTNSLGLIIDKDGNFSFNNNIFSSPEALADSVSVTFKATFKSLENPLAGKLISIGSPGGSRMEIGSGSFTLGVNKEGPEATIFVELDLKDGLVAISLGGADSFIGSVSSNDEIASNFNLGLGFSNTGGLYFKGGSLEIALPTHIQLGPIEISSITLGLKVQNKDLVASIAAGFNAQLGPLAVVVENIGIKSDIQIRTDKNGNLGPLDLRAGFKPPNGVGLAIEAAVVKGGGYLYFDFDKEEYAGILELDLSGIVSVKAIALITTKMPDGSKGFSLLMIITAEFGSPIQLGLGFTLSGVGGLLGLNRTMRLEVIATGIRDGGINSIMFPQNVIENAPRIISDLKKYFPVEEGTFLIGPMVKIGWGTPSLVTISLGIIIEIPGNIAILGVLKVALPDEDAAVVVIQVNFMGAIEFDKKRLWFFAGLFDSRVLFITLEGEMGLLVGWGDDASFVVSVGGFHPAFNPPPLPFGGIARIAIGILNTDYARVRVEAYFAVTSNSVQFGAKVELFFGVSAFNIDGHLAFDALFRFSPFYFIISISASLSIKVFGIGLFSVRFSGSLEGPTPWHIEGSASISLLFFDINADFSHTWGNEAETTLPPINIMPLLMAEFQKLENWQGVLPAHNRLLVSLRSFEQGAVDLILHPTGSLKISQRAVPLGVTIDKVGNQKPADANHFDVTVSTSGIEERSVIEESFAVGQYFAKSDNELLSAKSFQPIKGGVDLAVAGEQSHAPLAVKRTVRYEQIIVDTHFRRFNRPFFTWFGSLFGLFLNGNAVSESALSFKHQKKLKPFGDKVEVGKPLYSVAFNHNNNAFNERSINFTSQVQAEEFMRQHIGADANLAKQLHVIPQVEMQKAA